MMNVIIFCFGPFFALLPLKYQKNLKIKKKKKKKKEPGDIIILHMCTKIMIT